MAQTLLYVNEHLHDQLWDGEADPAVIRSFRPGDYLVMEVATGESIVISGHPAERGTFDRFCSAMGRPELSTDPRFVDIPTRMAHLNELKAEISAWALTIKDPVHMEEIMAPYELAVGVLRSAREICDTDWAEARDVVASVSDRGGGQVRIPNAPWRFSNSPEVGVRGEPRYRGEDNQRVLTELLGLTPEEIARLNADGVLSQRVPDNAI
jgi:crotonobetainyl-CoA:carnitine CoA-transferase CaiB-like acyl-CoA transferase